MILSSTWRADPIGLLAAKFYEVPFLDVCPDLPGAPRCEEVISWLRKDPEVTRYVVLDDDDDCLDELPLFQPTPKTGIASDIAKGIDDWQASVIRTCGRMQLQDLAKIFTPYLDEIKASGAVPNWKERAGQIRAFSGL